MPFHLVDTLQYDNNSPLDSFAAVLHIPYLDIRPNVNYNMKYVPSRIGMMTEYFSPILKIDSVVYVD